MLTVIKDELNELAEKHSVPRRTAIEVEDGVLDEEDLITNDRSVVVVTTAGYVKRMPLDDEFATTQTRGTRGKAAAKMSDEEDEIAHFFVCNDHDALLFITAKGVSSVPTQPVTQHTALRHST